MHDQGQLFDHFGHFDLGHHSHSGHWHHQNSDSHPGGTHHRRHFLRTLLGVGLTGASLLEVSFARAALARVQSRGASTNLFDIERVAEGVYCAVSRPAVLTNCNAAIFENSNHLLVADTHSKPSAAAALIAQIQREVSQKPVRYIVNTHFHWDHAQGTSAYRESFSELDIVASEPTRRLMAQNTEPRLKVQLEQIPEMISTAEESRALARSVEERAFYAGQIEQLRAYSSEMQSFSLELPTITFDDSYVLEDRAHDLYLSFNGRAHTAGDVVIHCPQKNILATGDLVHGFFPYIGDGYPREWPGTVDTVAKMEFTRILPGHGPVQEGQRRMRDMRNYIEELTERVAEGKRTGRDLGELYETITTASLKTLQANGYGDFLAGNIIKYRYHFGSDVNLQASLNTNIAQIYQNLDRR